VEMPISVEPMPTMLIRMPRVICSITCTQEAQSKCSIERHGKAVVSVQAVLIRMPGVMCSITCTSAVAVQCIIVWP
jgi:hypothetical protein